MTTKNLTDKLRLIAEDQNRRDYCETIDEAADTIHALTKALRAFLAEGSGNCACDTVCLSDAANGIHSSRCHAARTTLARADGDA